MGIVYANKKRVIGGNYIDKPSCPRLISRQSMVKRLTPQNVVFLKSLGLKVKN